MSSKKTANLGLHVWEPEDTFLRTEFNENTTMIDAEIKANEDRVAALGTALRGEMASGLAALNTELSGAIQTNSAGITAAQEEIRLVKFLDATLDADTTNWEIDVSDVDFFRYAELRMFVDTPATWLLRVHVNGITTSGSYAYDGDGTQSGTWDRLVELGSPHKYLYRIAFFHPKPGHRVMVSTETSSSGYFLHRNCCAPINWEELTTFNLTNLYSGDVVPAGTRVVLMGIRI